MTGSQHTDPLAGLCAGDADAIGELVRAYGGRVRAHCEAVCPPGPADAALDEAFAGVLGELAARTELRDLDAVVRRATRHAAARHAPVPAGGGARRRRVCALVPTLLAARAEGELGDADLGRLAGHLRRCVDCRAAEARFATGDAAFERPAPPLPDERIEPLAARLAGVVAPPVAEAPPHEPPHEPPPDEEPPDEGRAIEEPAPAPAPAPVGATPGPTPAGPTAVWEPLVAPESPPSAPVAVAAAVEEPDAAPTSVWQPDAPARGRRPVAMVGWSPRPARPGRGPVTRAAWSVGLPVAIVAAGVLGALKLPDALDAYQGKRKPPKLRTTPVVVHDVDPGRVRDAELEQLAERAARRARAAEEEAAEAERARLRREQAARETQEREPASDAPAPASSPAPSPSPARPAPAPEPEPKPAPEPEPDDDPPGRLPPGTRR